MKVLLVVLALSLGVCSNAFAAGTISGGSNVINFVDGSSASNDVTINTQIGGKTAVVYDRNNTISVGSGVTCTSAYGGKMRSCHLSSGDDLGSFWVSLGDGRDDATITYEAEPIYLFGGDGSDDLTGNAQDNNIDGGGGNDEIHAGDGDDEVGGQGGIDNLYGDDGNDTVFSDDAIFGEPLEADYVDCGNDSDRAWIDSLDRIVTMGGTSRCETTY